MVVIVFRSRLREGADLARLDSLGQRMAALAAAMPGFISYKDFQAEDGEALTLVEFDSLAALQGWRDHPEHQAAQQVARESMFATYDITVCSPLRAYRFAAGEGRTELDVGGPA